MNVSTQYVSAGFGFRDCDNSNETLTTLMEMVLSDEDIPEDCFIQHTEEGIDIICSNIGLAGTEVQLVNAMSREFVLKQILNRVKDRYDTILIDCMPSLGMITINALAASDEVLIPVEASYLPIKGLQQLLKTIGKVRRQINPKLRVPVSFSVWWMPIQMMQETIWSCFIMHMEIRFMCLTIIFHFLYE